MLRHHAHRAVAVFLLLAGMVVAMVDHDPGGPARILGIVGLAVLFAHAMWRAGRLYRAGAAASLPRSVGRVEIRTRPRRSLTAATVTLALVLPAGVAIALLALAADAVLCILGRDFSRLGRLFCTHPPTDARVKRLERVEARLQSGRP